MGARPLQPLAGGWATATAKLILARDEDEPVTDLCGLVGFRPRDGWMTMLSLGGYTDGRHDMEDLPLDRLPTARETLAGAELRARFGDGDSEANIGLGLSF